MLELWCNLEGRYVHLVKQDIAEASFFGVCSAGAYATKYARAIEIPNELQIEDMTTI